MQTLKINLPTVGGPFNFVVRSLKIFERNVCDSAFFSNDHLAKKLKNYLSNTLNINISAKEQNMLSWQKY